MTLVIGSFNIQDFSGQTVKKNLSQIAKIIRSENFHLLALQEILNIAAVERLCNELGCSSWASTHASPVGKPREAKGYAFIWRKSFIEPVSESIIWNEAGMNLTRPPLIGRFRFRGKRIQLITTQLYAKDWKGTEKQREYTYLCERVLKKIDRQGRIDHPATYSAILGDYNMLPHWCDECHSSSGLDLITLQRDQTTIKQDGSGYHLSLDHVTLNESRWRPFNPRISRVDAPTKYYGGDFSKYREEVSDHVPIKLEVDFYG